MIGPALPDFLAQLALMARAGLPLPEGLHQMATTAQGWRYRATCQALAADTAAGQPLATAMRRHPRHFSPELVQLIAVGEQTGTLPELLGEAAEFARKQHDLALRTRERLAYPCFGFFFAVAMLLAMMILVMPRVVAIIQEFAVLYPEPLPIVTRAVIWLTGVLKHLWPVAVVGLPLVLLGCLWLLLGRGLAMRLWLRLLQLAPFVGPELVRCCDYTRLSALLALYTRHGLSMVDGLRHAAAVLDHPDLRASVARWADELATGKTFEALLRGDAEADPMFMGSLANLPERELSAGLARLAEAYRGRAERARATLATWWSVGAVITMFGACIAVIFLTFLPLIQFIGMLGGGL